MRNYIFALLLLCGIGFSQTNDTIQLKKNSVFIEFLGNSVNYFSINYDRIIAEYDNSYLNLTVGISPDIGALSKYISIPVSINYTSSKRSNSHLELGVGLAYKHYYYEADRDCCEKEQILLISRIGYKYQRPQGGFNFKIALTPTYLLHILKGVNQKYSYPYFSLNDTMLILHYVGVGAGYTF